MSLRAGIASFSRRLSCGVVLFTVMLISLFRLSQDLHAYLGSFEGGAWLQVFSFGFLLLGAGVGLFWLQRGRDPLYQDQENRHSPDLPLLALRFLKGFVEGCARNIRKP